MTENNASPAMARAQAACEDAQAVCTGFEGASDLMDPSFNPERTPFADLDFQAGWNTAKAAKAAAIERLEREEAARPVATLFWEGDESTVPEFCPHGRKPYWYQNAFFVECRECVAAAIELTQGLKEALAAYHAALTREGDLSYAADAAYEQIHRATYEAQGPLPEDLLDVTDDQWAARLAIREAVEVAQRAIEAKVESAAAVDTYTPGPTCIHGLNGPCRVCGDQKLASVVDIDIFQLAWDLRKVASSLDDAARLVDGGRHTKDQLEGINERMLRSVNWARRLIRHDLETSRVFDGHLAYGRRDDHLAGAVSARQGGDQ